MFGVLAALALFLCLVIGHDISTCNSGIGQFAHALDQRAASQCTTVNTAHAAPEVVTVVLGVEPVTAHPEARAPAEEMTRG
jgi:hypothetical protein